MCLRRESRKGVSEVMNMLAIDCCLRLTGTALMLDGKVIESIQEDLGRKQSQELPLMAEGMMKRNNLTWNELDYIALTNGPGYFTGLRVGAAYASGLAFASNAKIIPVSSLEMLAHSSGLSGKILVAVYAGHGQVYAWCDGCLNAGEYELDEIHEWLKGNPDAKIISDDPERAGVNAVHVTPDMNALCELAASRIDFAVSPLELKVSYYRAPQGVK